MRPFISINYSPNISFSCIIKYIIKPGNINPIILEIPNPEVTIPKINDIIIAIANKYTPTFFLANIIADPITTAIEINNPAIIIPFPGSYTS